jgi:hypothetical protein
MPGHSIANTDAPINPAHMITRSAPVAGASRRSASPPTPIRVWERVHRSCEPPPVDFETSDFRKSVDSQIHQLIQRNRNNDARGRKTLARPSPLHHPQKHRRRADPTPLPSPPHHPPRQHATTLATPPPPHPPPPPPPRVFRIE